MRRYSFISIAQVCCGLTPLLLSLVAYVVALAVLEATPACGAEPTDEALHASGEEVSQFLRKW